MKQIMIFCIIYLLILVLEYRSKIKELERQKAFIERSRDRWEKYYRDYIQTLESKTFGNYCNSNFSQDTIEAVKFAMKHAHPDNGGNSEDFIKFKHCYDELIKGR